MTIQRIPQAKCKLSQLHTAVNAEKAEFLGIDGLASVVAPLIVTVSRTVGKNKSDEVLTSLMGSSELELEMYRHMCLPPMPPESSHQNLLLGDRARLIRKKLSVPSNKNVIQGDSPSESKRYLEGLHSSFICRRYLLFDLADGLFYVCSEFVKILHFFIHFRMQHFPCISVLFANLLMDIIRDPSA